MSAAWRIGQPRRVGDRSVSRARLRPNKALHRTDTAALSGVQSSIECRQCLPVSCVVRPHAAFTRAVSADASATGFPAPGRSWPMAAHSGIQALALPPAGRHAPRPRVFGLLQAGGCDPRQDLLAPVGRQAWSPGGAFGRCLFGRLCLGVQSSQGVRSNKALHRTDTAALGILSSGTGWSGSVCR